MASNTDLPCLQSGTPSIHYLHLLNGVLGGTQVSTSNTTTTIHHQKVPLKGLS